MRNDLTNFWLAWRETCDIRKCMDKGLLCTVCAALPEIVEDAEGIAEDAADLMKKTNAYMAGWISKPRRVDCLKWAAANVEKKDIEVASKGEADDEVIGLEDGIGGSDDDEGDGSPCHGAGGPALSQIEESDDDYAVRSEVIRERQIRGRKVSEYSEYCEAWKNNDLSTVSAFELIQQHLYIHSEKGSRFPDGTYEPMMGGKKLKDYLFEDIGNRAGGISQNLWGYLLKNKLMYVNGLPRPSRLIMVANESFKHSVVEEVDRDGESTPVVVPVDIDKLKVEINEAADLLRDFWKRRWVSYSVKMRVAICCAFMSYNMCDRFVEELTQTSGKRLSDVKNRGVGEVFMALKNGGIEADTVRGLLEGKGQSVLMEFVRNDGDDSCRRLVTHFSKSDQIDGN